MNLKKLNLVHKYGKDWESHLDELYEGVPNGWIVPNGQALKKDDYPELYEVFGKSIDKSSGNSECKKFIIPDFMGKSPAKKFSGANAQDSCIVLIMKAKPGDRSVPVGTITEFTLRRVKL